MTVVASLGAAYLQLVTSTAKRQAGDVATLKAFYVAEAGLAESFHNVQLGRSGQVASIVSPAQFGGGLVWVNASQTKDNQIRLVSTAMWGQGRATLSYVVMPKELTLGIFSDEDLVIDQVLMIDGYDSGLGSYEDQLEEEQPLPTGMPQVIEDHLFQEAPMGQGTTGCYLGYHDGCVAEQSHASIFSNAFNTPAGIALMAELRGQIRVLKEELAVVGTPESEMQALQNELTATRHRKKMLRRKLRGGGDRQPLGEAEIEVLLAGRDANWQEFISQAQNQADNLYDSYIEELMNSGPVTGETLYPRPGIGSHLADGAMLGSNGSVLFDENNTELQEIYGDITSGPAGSLEGEERIVMTGEYKSRGMTVDLPEVQVPDISMQAPVRHESTLPMLIPSGLSGLAHVEVAADSELIIQGPATVVLGDLSLEPGALLTLDTRSGDVALYVTGSMNLQPGSETVTTVDNPSELSLQVAPIESLLGEVPIKLESNSQFKGTIYSPGTEVYVGSTFEVFGGVVAKKITFGAGSRLHVDKAEYGGSPIPKVVSWRILELPDADQSMNVNPYTFVGRDQADAPELSTPTSLNLVVMDLSYVGHNGVAGTFTGYESDFDWSKVKSVVQVSRDSYRELEPGAEAKVIENDFDNSTGRMQGPRQSIVELAQWAETVKKSRKKDRDTARAVVKALKKKVPFTADEWAVLKNIRVMERWHLKDLSSRDVKAGGPGQ